MQIKTHQEEVRETVLSQEEVRELVKKHGGRNGEYELVYIDYSDKLDSNSIEDLLQGGEDAQDHWYEKNMDWICDAEEDSIRRIMEEMENDYEFPFSEETSEALRYEIQSHNVSNTLKDLLKNTGSQYFYYDLGLSFEDLCGSSTQEKDAVRDMKRIAKFLKLNYEENKKELAELVTNSCGGELCILFEDRPADLVNAMEAKKQVLEWDKFELCIMNRGEGSGHNVTIRKNIAVKYIPENMHSDKGAGGYSYSYDVCGLSGGFTDAPKIRSILSEEKVITPKRNAEQEEFFKREKELNARWKTGKCTFGDMKYSRHKEKEYINNFPCGNKCLACGTFWID